MQVVVEGCCGLDVHKKSITACVIIAGKKEIRSFSTVTQELLGLTDWLIELGVTHVAMESAGVYWKPVFNLLETSDFTLLLVNARHMNPWFPRMGGRRMSKTRSG